MKYIKDLSEGNNLKGIYYCKQKVITETKNGKPYESILLQDKTGVLDTKIWDVNNPGIREYEAGDFVDVSGEVIMFNGAKQAKVSRLRKAEEGEYDPADYFPVTSKSIDELFEKLLEYIDSVKNDSLRKLLQSFFVDDKEMADRFKKASAAKSVHHGFIGGLLEHTVSVTNLCDFYAKAYPMINRDLLITASLLHDIGKVREISAFPENDYTDEGQLLGHIVMGAEMIGIRAAGIQGFPKKLENELKHCILAHHGEYEYGSPKRPSLIEAVALNFADNTDAKLETVTELLTGRDSDGWIGYNKLLDSNLRKSSQE